MSDVMFEWQLHQNIAHLVPRADGQKDNCSYRVFEVIRYQNRIRNGVKVIEKESKISWEILLTVMML